MGGGADDGHELPVVVLGLLDHRPDARFDPIGLGGEGRPLSGEDAGDLELDLVEGRDRRQGVVPDGRRDVQGDLGRRVEPAVGDLVEDRVVPLVADAGQDGDRATGRPAGPVPGR